MIPLNTTLIVRIVAFAGLMLLSACRTRPVARPSIPDARVPEWISSGDSRLAASHLYAWRQAEEFYARAYEATRAEAIAEKLALTRFLIMTREMDEEIGSPTADSTIPALCNFSGHPGFRELCSLAEEYRQGYGATSWKARGTPAEKQRDPDFDFGNSFLNAYLRDLFLLTWGKKEKAAEKPNHPAGYEQSALFLYLNFSPQVAAYLEELEQLHPEFAELFAFAAEDRFQKARYTSARKYFRKALALIPDYTRALNGLANIYFFALEDWESAMRDYEATLDRQPSNVAALFGKGACLHHLNRYAESNEFMNRLLQSDPSRGGRASAESRRYLEVEGNYYLAYNSYLTRNPVKAREQIRAAQAIAPYQEHVSYLSGLLYFEGGELAEAQLEFEAMLKRGTTNCNARYYLGRILHEQARMDALSQFLGACSCMQGAVRNAEKQIAGIRLMDIEPQERVFYEERLKNKLQRYRLECIAQVEAMLQAAASSDYPDKEFCMSLMREVLAGLRK